MRYRKVGYFFELNDNERRSKLSALRQEEAAMNEPKIIAYLESGIDAGAVMMIEHDVLFDPPQAIGEVLLKTDGVWMWPLSLAYYVNRYHLTLPSEFIGHMAGNDWCIPRDAEYVPEIPQGHVEM